MNKNLNEFIKLVQDNPNLPVIPMVDEAIVADCGYSRWISSIGKSYIDQYWKDDYDFYFKSTNIEQIKEKVAEEIFWDNEDISDEELERDVRVWMGDIPWKSAIFVNIDIP